MSVIQDILISVLALVATLGILVTFHEYGHYRVARWCGVRVERFSVGFGKPLWRWYGKPQAGVPGDDGKPHRTEYVIAALPLGGYVRMLGEQGNGEVSRKLKAFSFSHKPLAQRAAIVAAGPIANFLLAILLYWLMFMGGVSGLAPVVGRVEANSPAALAGLQGGDEIVAVDGVPTSTWQNVLTRMLDRLGETGALQLSVQTPDSNVPRELTLPLNRWLADANEPDVLRELGLIPFNRTIEARLDEVLPEGRAAEAGLQAGDLILSADGETVLDWNHWLEIVRQHPEQDLNLVVERGGAELGLMLRPALRLDALGQPELDAAGQEQGYIGAAVQVPQMPQWMNRSTRYSPFAALPKALDETWDNSAFVLASLGKMLTGLISVSNISGPLTIAQVAGETASYGLEYYLGFLAVLSISLGVLNLLPIPVLDGGHLFYYGIEALIRRPVPLKAQEWGMQLGLTLIACLMFLALYNDVNRLF
ncbi:MAG: RIP metalloprotease RseP [Pseudomonadales bacterium]|jgi:regulator of sigma E protease|nr:RIP metalloprotease RseP [Pseudomonadales bacterium]